MHTSEVYITRANFRQIVRKSNIKGLHLQGEIYKIPIYFFSKYEENELLAIQELLKDPEKYFTEIYQPLDMIPDTYRLMYESKSSAYHKVCNCCHLKSDYLNFVIPEAIREQGKDTVIRFRKWFEGVRYLLDEGRADAFEMRLHAAWNIQIYIKSIEIDNSGIESFENYSIESLEHDINMKIKEAGRFYYQSEKHKTILSKFSKYTFLAYTESAIRNNNTPYPDKEIKDFLCQYDQMYKKPLKNMLIEYYRLKFNPDIKMEGKLLERLGFKPCGHCFNS